jgi:hypothetical protein
MNAAQLSPGFYSAYFRILEKGMRETLDLKDVVQSLYESSARRNGARSIQFSFATKVVHMTNPHLPIYDSRVAKFYFFQAPTEQGYPQERAQKFLEFYAFLVQEYERVLKHGLLSAAIEEFRRQLKPQGMTEEKIVDSLVWAFVTLLNEGGLVKEEVVYS